MKDAWARLHQAYEERVGAERGGRLAAELAEVAQLLDRRTGD